MSDSLTLQKIVDELKQLKQGDEITEQQEFILHLAADMLLEYKELWTKVNL